MKKGHEEEQIKEMHMPCGRMEWKSWGRSSFVLACQNGKKEGTEAATKESPEKKEEGAVKLSQG